MIRIQAATADEFLGCQTRWEVLARKAGLDPLFNSWDWISAWWTTFAPGSTISLHLLVAKDDDDEIVGLLPLTLRRVLVKGVLPVQRLQLIGNLWQGPVTMRSEYCDVPVSPERRPEISVAFANFLMAWNRWDDLVFQDFPDSSETINLIVDRLSSKSMVRDVGLGAADNAVVLDAGGSFKEFLSGLGYSTRRRLYLRRRYLESLGTVRLEYADESSVEGFFDTLNRLHEIRWGAPVFTGERLDFHHRIAKSAARSGDLFLSRLSVDGQSVSALYDIRRGCREYNLQMGFDDHFHSGKLSLGMLHIGFALERAFNDPRVRTFDLLAGEGMREPYKRHLSSAANRLRSLHVVRSRSAQFAYGERERYRSRQRFPERTAYTAVVTAAHTVTGYTTARSLRFEPVRLIGIGRTGRGISRSRLWREFRAIHDYDMATLLADLEQVAAGIHGPAVLVPSDDLTVELIAQEFERLSKLFRMVFPAPDIASLLLDKGRFYQWAAENGFPVPRTDYAYRPEDLLSLIESIMTSVIIKPIVRNPRYDAEFPNDKAFHLFPGEQLPTSPSKLFELASGYVVQEWVDGVDSDILFCLCCFSADGDLIGRCTGRKLVQWPESTGSTAVCVTEHDPEVASLATEVLRRAGLRGLGSVEFKRRSSDGALFIMEPTVGRNDHQSGIGLAAGVNMTAAYCRAALGGTPGRMYPSRRAQWIDEIAFARWAKKHGLRSALRIVGASRAGFRGRRYLASTACWDFAPTLDLIRMAGSRMFGGR